jgi:hypothetical protein
LKDFYTDQYARTVFDNKRKSAISAYAQGVLFEDVKIVFDPTIFGKADIGFIITTNARYRSSGAKNQIKNNSKYKYLLSEITDFDFSPIHKCFIVNGDFINCNGTLSKEVGEAFVKEFNSFLAHFVHVSPNMGSTNP